MKRVILLYRYGGRGTKEVKPIYLGCDGNFRWKGGRAFVFPDAVLATTRMLNWSRKTGQKYHPGETPSQIQSLFRIVELE